MSELGIYIVWQSGERYINNIIDDIDERFDILDAQSLHWSNDIVFKNLNKLYPHRKFKKKSSKVKEIGAREDGVRLHAIVVLDRNENIVDGVNLNFKNLKFNYREKYKTNFFHSADNEKEAIDNIKQILNIDLSNYADSQNKFIIFDNNYSKLLKSNVVNFSNIKEVFEVLNDQVNYIVLRNWDEFDNNIISEEHSDIDILTENLYETAVVVNAIKMYKTKNRVRYTVRINNLNIPFDFRFVGDNYYDINWQNELLKTKIKYKYFFIADNENYYFSLLYHAFIQKPFLSIGYKKRLLFIRNNEPTLDKLKNFMRQRNYNIVKPSDKSVYYRYSLYHIKNLIIFSVKKNIIITRLIKWIKR
jgi:hypothetical protein